ncbi:DUF1758 domain-containing protein [Trichonephila clavipes]|uniref:DUF1758 domain-containing protein n=1 Tax=Trichonephila clavipes TaxID=2585209 RepID=A0A8X6VKY2_TRICX|nr:DUF1758 domain-containing protein [Trichonephila clavipes]
MVRFQKHKYAFTTDIKKMFRMINIHPEQTCLQRILWKKGIGEPIKTYKLTRVTYSTVRAPYLATRTLKQLATDEANNFLLAAPVVLSDCYMDDILSGSESIKEIHRESRELKTFMANQVSKIHQLSSRDQWYHIASEQNPMDVLPRGLLTEKLRDDSLWWHGPELLLQSAYSTTAIGEPTQRNDFDLN